MATAKYKCPHCNKFTGIRKVYSNCRIYHKCTKCHGKNMVIIKGYEVWRPSQSEAIKEQDKP